MAVADAPVWRVAWVGNAVALGIVLALLVVVLPRAPRGFGDAEATTLSFAPHGPRGDVALIVVDGLRLDAVQHEESMPAVHRLGQEGAFGVGRIEALIPSTVSGIRTVVTGRAPGPASFLEDFRAAPAKDGGVMALAQSVGYRTRVFGPSLWFDLYGRWIEGGLAVAGVHHDDDSVHAAGMGAVRAGGAHGPTFWVLHLSAGDEAAHTAGGTGEAYQRALLAMDVQVAAFVDALPAHAAVVVTSDHGVSGRGGHAGAEASVRTVPVVVSSGSGLQVTFPPAGVAHGEVARILAAALGADLPPREVMAAGVGPALLSLLLVVVGMVLAASLALAPVPPGRAFALDAAVWITIALAAFVGPRTASFFGFGALTLACLGSRRESLRPIVYALGLGGLLGLARLVDGAVTARADSAWLPGALPWALALAGTVIAAAGLIPALLRERPRTAAFMLAATCVLAPRLLGETVSLSTVDVRSAFWLAEGPLGLLGGVGVVTALQLALPGAAGALVGWRGPPIVSTENSVFAVALGGVFLGQAMVGAGVAIGCPTAAHGALGLGLLLRAACEAVACFLGLGIAVAAATKVAARVDRLTGHA